MNDERMKQLLQNAVDHRLSGLCGNSLLAQRIVSELKGEPPVMKKRISAGMVLAFTLLLVAAAALAANISHVFGFMTNTAAKNWVLKEAETMLHTDTAHATLGDCMLTLSEWICDGEQLYVSIDVKDSALKTEGHFIPEDPQEEYLGGLNHYAFRYGIKDPSISSGSIRQKEWNFEWANKEENIIRYTCRYVLTDVYDDVFTVAIPVACSSGEGTLQFEIHSSDFGLVRDYQLPHPMTTPEYTLSMTRLRATALHTYAQAVLTFSASVHEDQRSAIALDYLDGLIAPAGNLDVVAGEGEEIALPRSLRWSEDGLTAFIEIEGNPRDSFPDQIAYYPRWGMHEYNWQGEMPPLSEAGALIMDMKLDR